MLLVDADSDLEPEIAEALRTAQFEAVTRHSLLMLTGNLFNAVVMVAVAAQGPLFGLALVWSAVMALFLSPAVSRWKGDRTRRKTRAISSRTLRRLTRNAAILGLLWGLAPLLFLDSGEGSRLIVGMVTAGMLCAGAFGLASIPLAAIAYAISVGGGYLLAIGLSHASVHVLAAPLTIAYVIVVIGAAISHGRSFADTVIARARAESAARHDPLTGLANRAAFEATLAGFFARLERFGEPFAALSIRFDTLQSLIYEWGPRAGEELLRQAALRLSDAVDERGALARIGDDRFAVVTRLSSDSRDARALAADIAASFDHAFVLETGLTICPARVGVAMAPEDGADAETLIAHADAEIHRVQGEPARQPTMNAGVQPPRRRELTREMRRSFARGDFFLQYQPIASLRSGRVEAFEALVRWRHPSLGVIPPLEFIDIAEKTGFIHDLGEWILGAALREAASWPTPARISVNVSGEQLCDTSFTAMFDRATTASGIDPRRVQIEVTESAALAAVDKATRALEALSRRGAEIVLDDFGVGYSSLVQIGRLPVKRLKIDRAFVKGLPLERKDAAIVETVIGLARALDLSVTAEGVETEAQRAYLALAGADCAQGYLIAKPLDAGEAHAWLDRQRRAGDGLAA
jgi:diguanylate cyclase (GGDEF)-like protein